jgi:signal transduction histidine kinase
VAYLGFLRKFLYNIANTGVDAHLSDNDLRKIRLTNQIVLVLGFATIPYIFLFNIFGVPWLAWLIVPVCGSFFSCIVLNHFRRYWESRMLFVILANMAAFYYSAKLGMSANVHNLYFAFVGFPLMLFEPKRVASLVFSVGLALLCYFFLLLNFEQHWISTLQTHSWSVLWISISANLTVFIVIILYLRSGYRSYQRYEESLINSNTSLQTAYEDLQLQQKLLEKSWHDSVYAQLTRTIAHELKNPLFEFGMVIGALKTSLEDKETALMFIDSLGQTVEELMELLHAMLESGGASVGEPKEMNLPDAMRRVLILAEGSMKKRNIRLHKEIDDLPTIMGDPKSYLMVFSNLIVNAMEAMSDDDGPGGDLTIRVKQDPSPVEGRNGIVVEISDTGVGIPKSRQANLFKGAQSTKGLEERQRGIGLALVWKLIDQMGGEITVHSDPDVRPGTMFRIVV